MFEASRPEHGPSFKSLITHTCAGVCSNLTDAAVGLLRSVSLTADSGVLEGERGSASAERVSGGRVHHTGVER